MTTSESLLNPPTVYVWVWLPDAVEHARHYHLDRHDAAGIVERHTDTILSQWNDVCDLAQLTTPERDQLWQRQFLNPASTSAA